MNRLHQFASRYNSNKHVLLFLMGALFLVLLLSAVIVPTRKSPLQSTPQKDTVPPLNLATSTLVYGTWASDASHIKAFDLESGKEYLLATLPTNIKKVSVLQDNQLLYINEVDEKDHGKELSIHTISTKTDKSVVMAADGFGIDDYVISPNKRFVATWEVQTNPETGVLQGGKSRVYTVDLLNPSIKHLIYDETASATIPVHYPRGILDNGMVYMDTFLPNSGVGWAYGMSASDFNGTQKQDLENMKNGSYATQPTLSPDGRYFAFTGYDATKGNGLAMIRGYRQALLSPNTIELLDTQDNSRHKLENIPSTNTYSSVKWNKQNGKLIYSQLSKTNSGVFSYDLQTRQPQQIPLPQGSSLSIIASLSDEKLLLGQQNPSPSSLGNLGSDYFQTLSHVSAFQLTDQKTEKIPLSDALIQYIDIQKSSYFSAAPEIITQDNKDVDQKQLQLDTFTLKPSLAPVREEQQSFVPPELPQRPQLISSEGRPLCQDWAEEQCRAQGLSEYQQGWNDCKLTQMNVGFDMQGTGGPCYDSPLYLYGPEGAHVTISVHTPIYNATPGDNNGTFAVTLGENGTIYTNGYSYNSISFDYTGALRRFAPPTKGSIVEKEQLEQTLKEYAQKLGLNKTETEDLVQLGKLSVTAPYAFISFFDDKTSKMMLPMTFAPQPNTYRNIIFYFKNLYAKPNYSIGLPQFEPIQRKGFTAIEISGMVE